MSKALERIWAWSRKGRPEGGWETPSDAAEALRQIKNEAYRAGQEVMRKRCETALSTPALRDHTVVAPARIISALPIEDLPEAQR